MYKLKPQFSISYYQRILAQWFVPKGPGNVRKNASNWKSYKSKLSPMLNAWCFEERRALPISGLRDGDLDLAGERCGPTDDLAIVYKFNPLTGEHRRIILVFSAVSYLNVRTFCFEVQITNSEGDNNWNGKGVRMQLAMFPSAHRVGRGKNKTEGTKIDGERAQIHVKKRDQATGFADIRICRQEQERSTR